MKEKYILLSIIFSLISCETTQDFKGEIIPDQKYISKLLNADKGQNKKVVSYLSQIIEDGSSSHLYYLRAKYLVESRQYKKANVDIQISLKSSPNDVDYLLLAGQIALNLEQYTSASNYFNLIKSTVKNQSFILFLLTEVSIKLNEYSLANYYLNQVNVNHLSNNDQLYYSILRSICSNRQISSQLIWNKLDANNLNDVRLQRFFLENGLTYTSKYLYQEQLLQFLNEYPNDPHLVRFWARFLNQINQFQMAELAYKKAIDLFEPTDYLYLEIGSFYMKHRNYTLALFYLNQIKPDIKSFSEVPFLKSKCYLYLGEKIRYKSMMDSIKLIFKNDQRFYQLKMKYFGNLLDSNLTVSDSLLTIKP